MPGAGEMAQPLRTLALAEDLGSILITYMSAHSHYTPSSDLLVYLARAWYTDTHSSKTFILEIK